MTTWILLRGLTRESGHWGDFIEEFARALPQAQVLALDLPGNGVWHRQRSPHTVQGMVEHCRAQLAALQLAPPYHVLSLSLGAMVGVAWAHTYPGEVAAQVLINTSMRPFSPVHQRLRPQVWGSVLKLGLFGATALQWEQTVLRLTSTRAATAVLAQWLELRRAHPVSRANALRQLLAAATFSAPRQPPAGPCLVLTSAQDQLVHSACSLALAQRWQCAVRVHPSAGHDLPLDDGPWVAQQVREWLAALATI